MWAVSPLILTPLRRVVQAQFQVTFSPGNGICLGNIKEALIVILLLLQQASKY